MSKKPLKFGSSWLSAEGNCNHRIRGLQGWDYFIIIKNHKKFQTYKKYVINTKIGLTPKVILF